MDRRRLNQTPQLHNKTQLKQLFTKIALAGLLLSGIFAGLDTTTDPQICTSCTYVIDGVDNSTLTLTGGEVICITTSGEFTGKINRYSGSGLVQICNEGIFDPSTINFNSGINQLDNYGSASPTNININGGTSTTIYNYENADFSPNKFNLRRSGTEFHNYGTFNPTNLVMDNDGLLYNHSSGEASLTNLDINGGTLINEGLIDNDNKHLKLNANSILRNFGQLQKVQQLVFNSNSQLDNQGSIQVNQHFTVNSATMSNTNLIQVGGNMTVNSNGTINNIGGIEVDGKMTINGDIIGSTSGNYGYVEVSGQTVLNGSGTLSGQLDICDEGSPRNGMDKIWGTVGPDVTYCENNGNIAMPVEYLHIDAEAKGDVVSINWTTSVELNNDYFTIERTIDGQIYESLGSVAGAGTTESMQNYQFQDFDPLPGRVYYRLKQTDFDGSSAYSNLLEVSTSELEMKLEASVYPNPTETVSTLSLRSPIAFDANLQVLSMSGQILSQRIVNVQAGNNKMEVDLSNFTAGIYFVNLIHQIEIPFQAQRIIKR
ncbi:MAG: T9SS type A sorting domain-containing protein [Bacteroidia bacterium]